VNKSLHGQGPIDPKLVGARKGSSGNIVPDFPVCNKSSSIIIFGHDLLIRILHQIFRTGLVTEPLPQEISAEVAAIGRS